MTLSLGGSRFLSPGTPPRASVDPGAPDRPAVGSAFLATARRLPGVSSVSSTDQVIDLRLIMQRVRRMAQLDATVFSEVRDDASQTLAATLVVLAVAAAGGAGRLAVAHRRGRRLVDGPHPAARGAAGGDLGPGPVGPLGAERALRAAVRLRAEGLGPAARPHYGLRGVPPGGRGAHGRAGAGLRRWHADRAGMVRGQQRRDRGDRTRPPRAAKCSSPTRPGSACSSS